MTGSRSFYGRIFAIAFLIGCALAGSLLLATIAGDHGDRHAPRLEMRERPAPSQSARLTTTAMMTTQTTAASDARSDDRSSR